MKEKLTLRNLLLWCAGLMGILVLVFSFLTSLNFNDAGSKFAIKNIIWGANAQEMAGVRAKIDPAYGPSVIVMIGVILVVLGAVCAVLMSLLGEKLVKDAKIRKIVLLVAGGLMVAGGVMHFFIVPSAAGAYAAYRTKMGYPTTAAQVLELWKDSHPSSAMAIVSGILAILGGGAACVSQFVKEK